MEVMKDLFYKPLKIKGSDDSIWFWSDLHLGQKCLRWPEPLFKKRGFATLEEHDETILNNWNAKVGPNDTIFILGDIIFGEGAFFKLVEFFNKAQFKTCYLMFGNHHAGTKQLFESLPENIYNVNEKADKQVIFVPNYLEAFVNGQPIVMSHYTLASFNGAGKGSWMVAGHSHGSLKNSELGKILYKSKTIDVGVENFSSPVSFKDLKEYFQNIKPITFDHHSGETQNPF